MIVMDSGKVRVFSTVAFSGDASRLAAGGDKQPTIVWETATGREVSRIHCLIESPAQLLAFHPRSPWLYITSRPGLFAFNIDTNVTRQLWSPGDFVRNLTLDPTELRLIATGIGPRTNTVVEYRTICFSVADPEKSVKLWERRDVDPPNEGWASLLAFYPDGKEFVSVESSFAGMRSDGPRITIRDTDTGEPVHTIRGAGTDANCLAISPTGEMLVTSIAHRLFLFDLKDLSAEPRELKNDSKKHFTGLAFHPSGKYLAVASNDRTVKMFDTANWQVAKTFTWNIGKMRCIAFSPDGTLAAAGSGIGKVIVWDVDV